MQAQEENLMDKHLIRIIYRRGRLKPAIAILFLFAAICAVLGWPGTALASDNVAAVDGNEYATVAEAIENAGDGKTVTLLTDASESITVPTGKNLVLNLSTHQLSTDEEDQATVTVEGSAKLKIANGSLSAKNASYTIVLSEDGTQQVELEGVTIAYSQDDDHYDRIAKVNSGTFTISSGAYTADLVADVRTNGTFIINGGVFNNKKGELCDTYGRAEFSINGGSFQDEIFHSVGLANGKLQLKRAGGYYDVLDTSDAIAAGHYAFVRTKKIGAIYESQQEAQAAKAEQAFYLYKLVEIKPHTVSFEADGKVVATQQVEFGACASAPALTPVKYGYSFKYWWTAGLEYDYSTPVYEDTTITARWSGNVAQINSTSYSTISEAVEDAKTGDVIKLLIDTDERFKITTGKDITLDLSGNTLYGYSNGTNIFTSVTVTGATFRLQNGNVQLNDCNGLTLTENATAEITNVNVGAPQPAPQYDRHFIKVSDGSTVAFNSGSVYSPDAAFEVGNSGELLIKNGTFSSDAGCIVSASANSKITIENGSFTAPIFSSDYYYNTLSINKDSNASVTGGTFSDPYPAGCAPSGYSAHKAAGGNFTIMSTDEARKGATCAVKTSDSFYTAAIYFEDASQASEYANALKKYKLECETIPVHCVTLDLGNGQTATKFWVEDGNTFSQPSSPTRSGYTFCGWYLGSEPYDFAAKVTKDITVKASWSSLAPAKVKNFKAKAKGKKKALLTWKKASGRNGVQIRYCLKKNMKKSKTALVKGAKAQKKLIKKLKSGKRYYFQVRAYKTVSGKKHFSAWSAKKRVKVK